ncbi:TerC family protein [Paenibacillus segetis]|uniref:Membrane protein YjbE n=1 Tax=Paenibacillus segetis TaxID=1325360 RepID=A0ABQ1YJ34_9BACL|nr:TerC family protein [Paenibacillus segetis]GGH26535.1 putative membrane protein YjbE [Paenibacillus segetis]
MEHLLLLSEILIINLVLSGDNAVVIALASNNLPIKQRKQAVWWGALGAVLLRCLLTWAAVVLLKIPFIQAAGGILLAGIAFKLLLPHEEDTRTEGASTMWRAVQTILVADIIMSLDNVLAIAALANGDLAVLVIGIAISIPIVVWGSNLIADWLDRLPLLKYVGAGILGYTAGKMLLHDPKLGSLITKVIPMISSIVPLLLAAVVIIFGWYKNYNVKRG